MNCGKGLVCFVRRRINSVPSSRIVKSAEKFVSKTYLAPSFLNKAIILPSTKVPSSIPNSSPKAILTDGDVLKIIILSEFFMSS